jgi:hypothetical protein
MNEQLLRRIQACAATLIAIAYFLPWASIMSPFGTLQIRGLYVDYAWTLLILALLQLTLQFATHNKDALALPSEWLKYLEVGGRVLPVAFVILLTWYGSSFAFNERNAASGRSAELFGTSIGTLVNAGLDYGYWMGVCGTVLLAASVGLLNKQTPKFAGWAALAALITVALAFGFSRSGTQIRPSTTGATPDSSVAVNTTSVNSSAAPNATERDFDSSPYVQVSSISAHIVDKDYEASRYRNSVVIYPIFKNIGSSTIVGLRGRLSVIDGFGKEVFGFNFRDDDKILPNYDSSRGGGYRFEENEFEDDDPYHKMVPLIDAGTAKYTARITQIALEDGTILPKK